MRRELKIFTEAILWDDRSIVDFIDADWGYLCEPLVQHYGLDPKKARTQFTEAPDSAAWRRVQFSDKRRGGLLTMGFVLMGTSKPERTSPVKRGKWVLETILGITPPPPPPDVDNELKPAGADEKSLTVRQMLERHRANAACYSCHRLIDPLGLGQENYDPIGRWREQEQGQPIDASGILLDGRKFQGVEDMRALILERKDDFVRCFVEKMLAYALGRRLEYYDVPTVKKITQAVREDDYKFSRVVVEIVKSYPFLHRRVQAVSE